METAATPTTAPACAPREIQHLRDLTPQQRKSGLAAWLGWTFDGLDMHLYTLVSVPYVALLMGLPSTDPRVGQHGAIINAAFLVGWALGGTIFGRIGDLLGRSRTLCLTILTYALFTGLSSTAGAWWHLLLFRFLAALGIGGEWAVGASLLSETWPRKWRPWVAATLQSGVNVGVLMACGAGIAFEGREPRYIFLVGVLPALLTLWIRRSVPEPDEWHQAREQARSAPAGMASRAPRLRDLFRGEVLPTTLKVTLICAVSLTAHWTFMYWHQVHVRNHPEVVSLAPAAKNRVATTALFLVMSGSILGNFASAWLAKLGGYRRAVVATLAAYFAVMLTAYLQPRPLGSLYGWLFAIGLCQGVFGLFTMALPPLFPTLLRTTGAGFCYNIGRIAAAAGTVVFGQWTQRGFPGEAPIRELLLVDGACFALAAFAGLLLPLERESRTP